MKPKNWGRLLRRKWKLITFIVIVIIGALWWYLNSAQEETFEYITQKPRRGDLIQTIDVSGRIDAEEKVRLRYQAGGKVVYLGAKEGQYVEQGQTLATIDQALLNKQLQRDLNLYSKQRWDWEQLRDDVVENGDDIPDIIPDLETRRTVDKAQWDLENSVLNVEMRAIALRDTHLTTPIEGILTYSPTDSVGTTLSPTDYFEVINKNTLQFKAEVDEEDIGKVSVGQPVEIELDAFAEESISTTVSYIPFTSSTTSNGTVFIIEMSLADAAYEFPLKLGMSGDGHIEVDRVNSALSVPIEAIRQRDGSTYVDVELEDGELKEKVVVTGIETDDEIEIIRGVDENDLVVIPQ